MHSAAASKSVTHGTVAEEARKLEVERQGRKQVQSDGEMWRSKEPLRQRELVLRSLLGDSVSAAGPPQRWGMCLAGAREQRNGHERSGKKKGHIHADPRT